MTTPRYRYGNRVTVTPRGGEPSYGAHYSHTDSQGNAYVRGGPQGLHPVPLSEISPVEAGHRWPSAREVRS